MYPVSAQTPEKKRPNLYVWIIEGFQKNKVPIHAGHITFFLLVSFFPFVAFVTKMASYTKFLDHDKLEQIFQNVDVGIIGKTIMGWVDEVQTSSGGLVIVVSVVVLLWTGSKGVDGIAQGLDSIYGSSLNMRGYARRRLSSVIYLIATVFIILTLLIITVFGSDLTKLIIDDFPLIKKFHALFVMLRYVVSFAIFITIFVLIFRYIPYMPAETKEERKERLLHNKNCAKEDRIKKPKIRSFKTEIPGALLTSVLMVVFSRLYGAYMSYQMSHNTIYGSLTAFFLTLLWIYYCTMFIFAGALYNTYYYETGEFATKHIILDIPGLIKWLLAKLPSKKKKGLKAAENETTE